MLEVSLKFFQKLRKGISDGSGIAETFNTFSVNTVPPDCMFLSYHVRLSE